jgi:hypothetical protein
LRQSEGSVGMGGLRAVGLVGGFLPRQNARVNLLIAATIAGGLLVDQHMARYGQLMVNVVAWLVFAALWLRSDNLRRPALLACLAFATAGEVFLSLVWGLYEYRLGNIPLFVPPGHVLLFCLGVELSRRMRDGAEWWIALAALPLVGVFAYAGRDTLGPWLYALFLACLWLSPSRKLYATMFVLSLAMELYGTWLGNWTWAARDPWFGLASDNPPLAAGAFYCVLDFLVVSAVGRRVQSPASAAGSAITDSHHAATCSARSSSR